MNGHLVGADYTIRPVDILDSDIPRLAKELSDNNSGIVERLNAMVKKCLQRGEVSDCEPPFAHSSDFLEQYPAGWYRLLWSRVGQEHAKGSILSTIFPTAVYLYESYGLPPSKLILGHEMTTTLPIWLQSWMHQVSKLPDSAHEELYKILYSGRIEKRNVVYTLKARLSEIAAAYSLPMETLALYPGILPSDTKMVADFVATPFRESSDSFSVIKPFLGNQKLLRMLICVCAIYNVTPEYLLLQDYSEFVLTAQGWHYPPSTRKLISLVLTVDAGTRARAIGFGMAASAVSLTPHREDWFMNPKEWAYAHKSSNTIDFMVVMLNADDRVKESKMVLLQALKEQILATLRQKPEPVSTQKLYTLAKGHSSHVRKAITELKKEGKIERVDNPGALPYWKLAKHK